MLLTISYSDKTATDLGYLLHKSPPSTFLSVAIARTFSTAITGKSKERQELADTPLPLEARITVLPCRGGENLLRRLFEPLGYEVAATRHPLDEKFPWWGESPYFSAKISLPIHQHYAARSAADCVPAIRFFPGCVARRGQGRS